MVWNEPMKLALALLWRRRIREEKEFTSSTGKVRLLGVPTNKGSGDIRNIGG